MAWIKCLMLLTVAGCAMAANFYNTGECPDNHAAGERWYPFGTCLECYCDMEGYGCQGCDTVTPIQGCYTQVDTSLQYPECCPRLVCPPVEP